MLEYNSMAPSPDSAVPAASVSAPPSPSVSAGQVDWIRRAIAIGQVLGGAMGTWFTIPIVFSGGFLIGLPFCAFYVGCILAGIGLWRQTARGERWSRFLQLVQVPWIRTAHVGWQLACGAGLWSGIGSGGWAGARRLGSMFDFHLTSGFGPQFNNAQWTIGVNYLAAIVLVYLLVTRRAVRK